jgi:outer membrane murein-binding lipoprotein Lpp
MGNDAKGLHQRMRELAQEQEARAARIRAGQREADKAQAEIDRQRRRGK